MTDPPIPEAVFRSAMDQALRLLGIRARSRAELAERLTRKGIATEVVDAVLRRLGELRLVDDAQLSRSLVLGRRQSNQGDFRIRRDLRRRGLAAEDVERALGEEWAPDRAWAALIKRAPRLKGLDRDRAYRRLHGYLARRGFGVEESRQALRRYFSGEPEERENEEP